MKTIASSDITSSARTFVWLSARLLERLRFEQLFDGGAAQRVQQALDGYQNTDGGFGQALEPDFRGPVSQPVTVLFALQVLDEIGRFTLPTVQRALDYLQRASAADGGLPFVTNSVLDHPRAPWWQPDPAQPGCLLPTAAIAGLLHKHAIYHPLRERADAFCWRALSEISERIAHCSTHHDRLQVAYETRSALTFLEHAPERARAASVAASLGRALLAAGMITLDAAAPDQATGPLDFAPRPSSPARAWFDDALIERHLDALQAQQREDGGFTFSWPVWTPVMELEWRGVQTVEKLKVLRAYGRV